MEDDILVSVIIPVYKVEDYLKDCVDSILNQSYKNLEIILVDDGSPDSCGKICDDYKQKDERILVIHKENGGLSDARNVGMERATGEYFFFIDSDDLIDEKCVEILLHEAVKEHADIVQAEETHILEKLGTDTQLKKQIYNAKMAFQRLLLMEEVHVMACNKLYRAELFQNITFPKGFINEDNWTTYKVILKAKKVVCIPQYLYFYRVNEKGIMHTAFNKKKLNVLNVIEEMCSYVPDINTYEEELEYYKMRLYIRAYNDWLQSSEQENYQAEIKSIYDTLCGINQRNHFFQKKYKIMLWMLQKMPHFYSVLIKHFRTNG